ncbi:MAG: hypothetical protein ACLTDM_06960 [Clostridium butyricum]
MDKEKATKLIQDVYYDELNFCGCGSPSDTLYVIKNVLKTHKNRHDRFDYADYSEKVNEYYDLYKHEFQKALNLNDEYCENDFYTNEGVYQIVLNVLNNANLMEHGSSIGGSWLTKKGEEFLEALELMEDEFNFGLDSNLF